MKERKKGWNLVCFENMLLKYTQQYFPIFDIGEI